jgi:hypothetical protein
MAEEHETSKLVEMFPHSIEVSKGVKGGYGWTIKVRFKDTIGLTPETMALTMSNIDKALRKEFPEQGA